jgi:hypothetical protein
MRWIYGELDNYGKKNISKLKQNNQENVIIESAFINLRNFKQIFLIMVGVLHVLCV